MATTIIPNAPAFVGLDEFLAVADSHLGFAKSARFIARIVPVGRYLAPYGSTILRDLMYLCEVTDMPGRGFQAVDLRYYGPSFKMPYQSSYEDINMTFLCRAESFEREFFDDWMEMINPVNNFDFNYRDDYRANIQLFQFSDIETFSGSGDPTPQYAFEIFDAFPVLVNPQPVTWADEQFMRLGVTLTYRWWYRKGRDDLTSNVLNATDTTYVATP